MDKNLTLLWIGLATTWAGCGRGEQSPLSSTPPGAEEAPSIQTPVTPEVREGARACDPGLPALAAVGDLCDGDTYAVRMEQSYFAEVPILGVMRYSLRSSRLATFGAGVSGWELRVRTCALALSAPTEIVRTVFPDAFVRSLPEQIRSVRFVRLASGVGFCAPRQLEIRGAALGDAESDPLPRSPDDARLVDQDGDGRPGVTVRVSGLVNGEVYVVQKDWYQLEGDFEAAAGRPTLQGTVAWQTEQVVLGADNPILDRQQLTSPDPDSANNRFSLLPVDATATCADLALAI